MSIHAALESALPPGSLGPRRMDTSVFCDFHDFELLNASVRDLIAAHSEDVQSMQRYAAVSGHFSLATLLQLTAPSSIGTILREPRARTLSLYLYWRTPKIFDAVQPYRAHQHALLPLDQFMAEPRVAPAIDNQVCRLLLAGDPRIPREDFIAGDDIDGVASDAIAQLDTLGFVGVLEHGERGWQGLSRLFGVSLEPRMQNVTGENENPVPMPPGEKLVTSDALDLIERRNAADQIVYDHALALAGVQAGNRTRLAESSFASQLVQFGDLLGRSAAKHARVLEEAHAAIEQQEQLRAEATELCVRLESRDRAVRDLNEQIGWRTHELRRERLLLDAMHTSVSWRVTAPLRAGKRLARRLRSTDDTTL